MRMFQLFRLQCAIGTSKSTYIDIRIFPFIKHVSAVGYKCFIFNYTNFSESLNFLSSLAFN